MKTEWKKETSGISGYFYFTGPGDLRIRTNDRKLSSIILGYLNSENIRELVDVYREAKHGSIPETR